MRKLVVDYLKSARMTVPANPAVLCGDQSLCYVELDVLSDKIAVGLQSLGICPGERIGIYMPKTVTALAAIYAILKAGCCYVPIAVESPLPSIAYMLDNCGIRFVLAATRLENEVGSEIRGMGANVIAVKDLVAATGSRHTAFTMTRTSAQDAAAVLHTSGSTGRPKGAVITHENLAVFLSWSVAAFDLRSHDRLLSHAPLQFDLSFFDLFAAAAASAAVVLATPADTASPTRMSRLANKSGVTVWQSVPSALTLQAVSSRRQSDPMRAVRCVLFAGERLPRQTLLGLPKAFPNARFYNVYGCTETNDTFLYPLPHDVAQAPDPLPIGKPLPHIEYRIVDESGRQARPGQAGHLLVSGDTVMAGYLSPSPDDATPRPVRTPEDCENGFYRTKDIVSIGADGNLRFHGRVDAVIKSNGYRVNLMEIEDHLRRSQKLEEVALLGVADALIGNRIIAIVRPCANQRCSILDLKLYCAEALPKYAIPHCFHIIREELPKGHTGKVDKRRLAEMWQQAHAGKPGKEGEGHREFAATREPGATTADRADVMAEPVPD